MSASRAQAGCVRPQRELHIHVCGIPSASPRDILRVYTLTDNVQLDSLKSRLQTIKTRITVPQLAVLVYKEEGFLGFYRGIWIPLLTISFVRA